MGVKLILMVVMIELRLTMKTGGKVDELFTKHRFLSLAPPPRGIGLPAFDQLLFNLKWPMFVLPFHFITINMLWTIIELMLRPKFSFFYQILVCLLPQNLIFYLVFRSINL